MSDTQPQVTRTGLATIQVCVPSEWTDEQILSFANNASMTGLDHGWSIVREGSELLKSCPERNQCEERRGFVHVLLEC